MSMKPLQVFMASWWMALYGSLTPKRHVAYSNAATVRGLDLGVLRKHKREKLSKHKCKSSRTYKNKRGRKVFCGTRFLKQTQIPVLYLVWFSLYRLKEIHDCCSFFLNTNLFINWLAHFPGPIHLDLV